jgi:hypothetical protein
MAIGEVESLIGTSLGHQPLQVYCHIMVSCTPILLWTKGIISWILIFLSCSLFLWINFAFWIDSIFCFAEWAIFLKLEISFSTIHCSHMRLNLTLILDYRFVFLYLAFHCGEQEFIWIILEISYFLLKIFNKVFSFWWLVCVAMMSFSLFEESF